MRFLVIFGKGLVYSTRCIFLHIKHRNVLFTFPESEENLLLSYCYIKQQNKILNVRIKRLVFGLMILSDCHTKRHVTNVSLTLISFKRYNCLANSIQSHETLRLLAFYFPQYAYYPVYSLSSPLSAMFGMELSPLFTI